MTIHSKRDELEERLIAARRNGGAATATTATTTTTTSKNAPSPKTTGMVREEDVAPFSWTGGENEKIVVAVESFPLRFFSVSTQQP